MHITHKGIIAIFICCTIVMVSYLYYRKQHLQELTMPSVNTTIIYEDTKSNSKVIGASTTEASITTSPK